MKRIGEFGSSRAKHAHARQLSARPSASLVAMYFAFSAGAHATGCHPQLHSNVGCNFYAVALPNPLLVQAEQNNPVRYDFAIGVVNVSSSGGSALTISGGALVAPETIQLAAGTGQTVALPRVDQLWQATTSQKIANGAYYIAATNPISATQYNTINPLSGTNDASLLLPIENAGTSFRALVWPTVDLGSGTVLPGELGIVATRAGTTVQVQASSGVFQPGTGLITSSGGAITLNAGDVMVLTSAGFAGVDPSGAVITSDAPVLVWSAHTGAQVPVGALYVDYMEEMLPPVAALGNDYVVARPSNPTGASTGAKQYVKIVGTAADTNLVFNPSIAGTPQALQAGQVATFASTQDFAVHSDHPIIVAQFMESALQFGGENSKGDPSEIISVPTTQAQTDVAFYAPQALAPNYAQIIAPTGATVAVDGTSVSGWTTIGTSGYAVANVSLCCTDAHRAVGSQPFLISVYSYAQDYTSYWYPASRGIADDIFADGLN